MGRAVVLHSMVSHVAVISVSCAVERVWSRSRQDLHYMLCTCCCLGVQFALASTRICAQRRGMSGYMSMVSAIRGYCKRLSPRVFWVSPESWCCLRNGLSDSWHCVVHADPRRIGGRVFNAPWIIRPSLFCCGNSGAGRRYGVWVCTSQQPQQTLCALLFLAQPPGTTLRNSNSSIYVYVPYRSPAS